MELMITSIMQMHEVEEHIKDMYVTLEVNELTETFVRELTERIKESKGKTILRIKVRDNESDVAVQMYSNTYKILPRDMVAFFEDNGISKEKYQIK